MIEQGIEKRITKSIPTKRCLCIATKIRQHSRPQQVDEQILLQGPLVGRLRVCNEGLVNLFDGMVAAENTTKEMVSEMDTAIHGKVIHTKLQRPASLIP